LKNKNKLFLDSQIFTGVFYTHYDAPQGFCFDESWCRDDAIVDGDDPMLAEDNNVANSVDLFLKYAIEYVSDEIIKELCISFLAIRRTHKSRHVHDGN
jgi:hypothetical protein